MAGALPEADAPSTGPAAGAPVTPGAPAVALPLHLGNLEEETLRSGSQPSKPHLSTQGLPQDPLPKNTLSPARSPRLFLGPSSLKTPPGTRTYSTVELASFHHKELGASLALSSGRAAVTSSPSYLPSAVGKPPSWGGGPLP